MKGLLLDLVTFLIVALVFALAVTSCHAQAATDKAAARAEVLRSLKTALRKAKQPRPAAVYYWPRPALYSAAPVRGGACKT